MENLVLVKPLGAGIVEVTVNNPKAMNALSAGILAELKLSFMSLCADISNNVVILRGAPVEKPAKMDGDKVVKPAQTLVSPFAGANLLELIGITGDPKDPAAKYYPLAIDVAKEKMLYGIETWSAIRRLCTRENLVNYTQIAPLYVIGIVTDFCFAGGWELLMGVCNQIVIGTKTIAGFVEAGIAAMPGWDGQRSTLRFAGPHYGIMCKLLTGQHLSAEQVYSLGLATDIVENDKVLDEAMGIAKHLVQLDHYALRLNLQVANLACPTDQMITEQTVERMVLLMTQPTFVEKVKDRLKLPGTVVKSIDRV